MPEQKKRSGSIPILRLPPELRSRVIRTAVVQKTEICCGPEDGPYWAREWQGHPLLYACSDLRREASPIYYMENMFATVAFLDTLLGPDFDQHACRFVKFECKPKDGDSDRFCAVLHLVQITMLKEAWFSSPGLAQFLQNALVSNVPGSEEWVKVQHRREGEIWIRVDEDDEADGVSETGDHGMEGGIVVELEKRKTWVVSRLKVKPGLTK